MVTIRPFLNTDVPGLVDLWRRQPPNVRIASALNVSDWELLVLGKPYFDREGFLVAEDAGQIVGFAHAGFGPNEAGSDLDYRQGIICLTRVLPEHVESDLPLELIGAATEYLRQRGADEIFAGARFPHVPFYLGVYGGSRIPGIPVEDRAFSGWARAAGFQERDRIRVCQLPLQGFRVPVNRELMRRQFQVFSLVDPRPSSWWEYCTYGMAETFGFQLSERGAEDPVGQVMFWEIHPLSSEWGVRTVGMCDLWVRPELRRQGLARFLVGQALTQLANQGISRCEVQLRESDAAMMALVQSLEFSQISSGVEWALPAP